MKVPTRTLPQATGSLGTLSINGTPPEVENLSSCIINVDMSEAVQAIGKKENIFISITILG